MIPTTVSDRITSNDLPMRTTQLSKAQMEAVQGGGITSVWRCYYYKFARPMRMRPIVITWGHTPGDALWACREWINDCRYAPVAYCRFDSWKYN